jgi:2-polyprenyl-3-methyl-5-hydroxy-6-metoxy-1,4-benzoquinol methylase
MSDKIDSRWEQYNTELDKVDISNIREAVRTGYLTKTISGEGQTAVDEIRVLQKQWNLDNSSIIEIGAGYGAYCEAMHNMVKVNDYTILDTKSMLRFAKAYLKEKCINCTFLDTEEPLPEKNYDLLISNVCISEIPLEHAKELLTNLFKRVKRVAIMDCDLPWLIDLIKENFDVCAKNTCSECNQNNHFLYLGEKK